MVITSGASYGYKATEWASAKSSLFSLLYCLCCIVVYSVQQSSCVVVYQKQ